MKSRWILCLLISAQLSYLLEGIPGAQAAVPCLDSKNIREGDEFKDTDGTKLRVVGKMLDGRWILKKDSEKHVRIIELERLQKMTPISRGKMLCSHIFSQ